MGRPKGSKTQKSDAYAGRSARVKRKYGADVYRKWGKMGGNPVLLREGKC